MQTKYFCRVIILDNLFILPSDEISSILNSQLCIPLVQVTVNNILFMVADCREGGTERESMRASLSNRK
jgi:hypothetical protein